MLKFYSDVDMALCFLGDNSGCNKSSCIRQRLHLLRHKISVLGGFRYFHLLKDLKLLSTVVGVATQAIRLPQSIFVVLFHYKVPDVLSTVTKYSVLLENCFVNKIKDHQLWCQELFH